MLTTMLPKTPKRLLEVSTCHPSLTNSSVPVVFVAPLHALLNVPASDLSYSSQLRNYATDIEVRGSARTPHQQLPALLDLGLISQKKLC